MVKKFVKIIPGLMLVVFPLLATAEKHEMQGGMKSQQEMQGGMKSQQQMQGGMKGQHEMPQMQGRQGQMQDGNKVYGWQLMSPAERQEYQKKMRSFKSKEERQEFLEDHREKMQERADEMGVTLPKMRGEK